MNEPDLRKTTMELLTCYSPSRSKTLSERGCMGSTFSQKCSKLAIGPLSSSSLFWEGETSNFRANGCSTLRKAEDLMPRDIMSSEPRHWMMPAAAGAPAQHCTAMTNWPNTIQCLGSDDIMSLDIKSSAFLRVGHPFSQKFEVQICITCLQLVGTLGKNLFRNLVPDFVS